MLRRGYESITLRVMAGLFGYGSLLGVIVMPMMGGLLQSANHVASGQEIMAVVLLWLVQVPGLLFVGFVFHRVQSIVSWCVPVSVLVALAMAVTLLQVPPAYAAALPSGQLWIGVPVMIILIILGFLQAHHGWIRASGAPAPRPCDVPPRWPSRPAAWAAATVALVALVGGAVTILSTLLAPQQTNAGGMAVYAEDIGRPLQLAGQSVFLAALALASLLPVGRGARWVALAAGTVGLLVETIGQAFVGFVGVAGVVHAVYLVLGAVAAAYGAGVAFGFEIRFLPRHAELVRRHGLRRPADAPSSEIPAPHQV